MKARRPPGSSSKRPKVSSTPPQNNDGDTNICDLPEPILHKILSFLDMREVVRTCVLSKRWEYLWTSLSTININSSNSRRQFVQFVDQALFLRDGSNIERMCFNLDARFNYQSRLNSWIRYALIHNVQELCINLGGDVLRDRLLPISLFTSESLKVLTVTSNSKHHFLTIVLPASVSLPNLKTLHFTSCSFNDCEDLINKLLSSCTLLESLEFFECVFININLINIYLPKLKNLRLDICHSGSIKLYAPNLTRFICKHDISREFIVEDFPSLVEANIDMTTSYVEGVIIEQPEQEMKVLYAQSLLLFLRTLHNVRDLVLTSLFIGVISGAPELLYNWHTQFGNLRCLKVEAWLSISCVSAIAYLLMISPNIETLTLSISEINIDATDSLGDAWVAGLSFDRQLQHLKYVKIEGVEGFVIELNFLKVLLKSVVALEKLEVLASKTKNEHALGRHKRMIKFSEKLLSFPRASRNIAISISS